MPQRVAKAYKTPPGWYANPASRPEKVCPTCGKAFRPRDPIIRFCSRRCVQARNGAKPKHGHSIGGRETKTYSAWKNMVKRCTKPDHKMYPKYGGRGITVCARWLRFEDFLADMGEPPTPKHSIDRINNDGGYEPGNCRWATAKQQARNTRKTRKLTFLGETLPLPDWAERLGVTRRFLSGRLERGWTTAALLTTPPQRGKPPARVAAVRRGRAA